MGEVKDEIKGPAPKRKAKTPGAQNLLESVRSLKDELSELIAQKDDDALTEGDEARPRNLCKAAILRACHTLLGTIQVLLEDY